MRQMSLRAARLFLRLAVKPKLTRSADFAEATRALDLRLPYDAPPQGFRAERIGGVAGEWAASGSGAVLVYLHGGAYFAGTARSHRPITSFFARRGFDVFAPSYRLAPRHPFPAALEDALAVYGELAGRGARLALAGDSAGGGLALATMLALRDAGSTLPVAAALFSPWTDLAITGASAREEEARDPLFTRRLLKIGARAYLAGARADDPRASPLYGEPGGLPPILIHVGEREILRDDSARFAARAVAAGVDAEVVIWPGVPHGWQLASGLLQEARDSLDAAAAFLRSGGASVAP
ncbi:MAG TPA: alpha/beta hydrolase [Methylocystis sp.]|nr:alpha/beta hydrolase [Methylocystis sp.]